jgi:hypothetical protein
VLWLCNTARDTLGLGKIALYEKKDVTNDSGALHGKSRILHLRLVVYVTHFFVPFSFFLALF